MSVPQRYQPSERLIDNPERLEQLYCDDELTIREIAEKHADVGRTRVSDALREYGIKAPEDHSTKQSHRGGDHAANGLRDDCSTEQSNRGRDPPSATSNGPDWSSVA